LGIRPNVSARPGCKSVGMNDPEQPEALPLQYAAQIVSELNSMRRECSQLAGCLMSQKPANERGVAECARLDSVLVGAHGVLRDAVNGIRPPKRSESAPAALMPAPCDDRSSPKGLAERSETW
jgi:hypothetical protein